VRGEFKDDLHDIATELMLSWFNSNFTSGDPQEDYPEYLLLPGKSLYKANVIWTKFENVFPEDWIIYVKNLIDHDEAYQYVSTRPLDFETIGKNASRNLLGTFIELKDAALSELTQLDRLLVEAKLVPIMENSNSPVEMKLSIAETGAFDELNNAQKMLRSRFQSSVSRREAPVGEISQNRDTLGVFGNVFRAAAKEGGRLAFRETLYQVVPPDIADVIADRCESIVKIIGRIIDYLIN